jgi:hypothetical protein
MATPTSSPLPDRASGARARPRRRQPGALYNFFAYEDSFGGVYAAVGDLTGDGKADILTGPGAGRAPEVRAFHGADTAHLARFRAYDASFTGGVRVAAVAGADGLADIVTGQGPDGGPLRLFDGQTLQPLARSSPYGSNFTDGLFVGASTPAAAPVGLLSDTPTVRVSAVDAQASELGQDLALLYFIRDGDPFYPTPITVNYTVSGTASNGVDYQTLSGSVTIGAGPPGYTIVNVRRCRTRHSRGPRRSS